jgi:hypothetical protein
MALRLRDLEGFRLLEDHDPDREQMKGLSGLVHTTKTYPITAFSDAEWTSEERERYLKKFGADVDEAKAKVAKGE